VFAIGAGDRLVAVSEYSDYPPAVRQLPRVANASGIDFERVLGLQPSLVLAWRSGNGPAAIRRLEQLGLVVYAAEPRRPADIPRLLRALSKLTGTDGDAAARKFESEFASLRERYRNHVVLDVFYQISERPLMTLNGLHMISAAIEVCGGRNVFADFPVLTPTISAEDVLRADPDVILIDSSLPYIAQVERHWLTMQTLKAAARRQVYVMDADLVSRQSPRFVAGARQLCETLERARDNAETAR